ncbi:TIGR03435 family protein [Granulicella sp. S156]|uniref:TIGR03435 family protein n=1 Tax=Granulicella sp. S156 TaxID=1747224 RepID=UPI00131BDA28|nr:TIGR03435 family protein [Granulicella sp. S156]
MIIRRTFLLLATSLTTSIALAQTTVSVPASPTRAFEVASIRPHQGLPHVIGGFSSSGPRLTLEAYTWMALIEEAYNLKGYQVSASGPDLPSQETYFDIAAIAEGNSSPTRDEFRPLLQTLLTQRFNLKFHFAIKEINVYALTVSKSGAKFKSSAPDTSEMGLIGVHGRNQTLSLPRETMASLATDIANSFIDDRPVVDRTGLIGTYDIKLEATPEFRIDRNSESEDISVFTAVQEQLGLKLEPAKANIQILVVDHIDKPTEN